MHHDLDIDAPERVHADVAVIGAGAAGITMCRRLLAGGLHVVLLESGGLDYEPATADLNDGVNIGQPYYDLEDARLRFFGGTTAVWGGRCAEFDPIDFQKRDWVPHSGWPIDFDDIRPYYAEARAAFGLPERLPDARSLSALPAFSRNEIVTPIWSFDEMSDRFSFKRSRDVIDHPRCTVITHATVREIVAAASGRGIERLDVRALSGKRLTVSADDYVLAAGGIENARLLLASRSVMPMGLGNGYDQVGRYFMEHPHARGGRIVDAPAWRLFAAFQKQQQDGMSIAPLIAPAPSLQRREGLLNTSLTIAPRQPATGRQWMAMRAYEHARHTAAPTQSGRRLWKLTKRTVHALQGFTDPMRPWLLHKMGKVDVALLVRAEQAPNPDSRVLLSRERDAIGMPRVALDWRTSDLDVDSVAGLVGALGRETERLGLGRVEPEAWLSDPSRQWKTDPLISSHAIGGYHHMGTTRMSHDPRRGVTDAFGRVHGIGNLHVAGSSLFPTSGWANPTLTIAALAMRTADALLQRNAVVQPSLVRRAG